MTTTDSTNNKRIARIAGIAVAVALLAVPAIGKAATPFGAKLTPDVQPSNAETAHPCAPNPARSCTRVLMDAYGRAGQSKAPKSGKIKRIKLIAGEAGSFRLQIVKVKAGTQQAKLMRNGPLVRYQGQPPLVDPDEPAEAYRVETFKVNVKVKRGEQLAIKSRETSMLRCSSGGANQLLFQAPLALRSPFRTASETDGCWLLLEGVIG